MATADTDDVEPRLFAILEMVNGWLQFAETKNTGHVALAGVGVAVIVGFIGDKPDMPGLMLVGLLLAEALLVASLAVALISFFPQSDLADLLVKDPGKPAETDNLYYYGHLSKYSPPVLAEAIARLYAGVEGYDPSCHRSHTDLAAQIIVNSTIASAKFSLFRTATKLAFASIAAAAVFTLASVVMGW